MYTQSTLENNTPTKIRRTDSDSFGFYAATPSAPSKLQTRFMIEHLSSEPASSSAGSDLLYTNDDLTSVPNLLEDFKDVKRTLRIKENLTDSKLQEHDCPQLIEDEVLTGFNFLNSHELFDDQSDLLPAE